MICIYTTSWSLLLPSHHVSVLGTFPHFLRNYGDGVIHRPCKFPVSFYTQNKAGLIRKFVEVCQGDNSVDMDVSPRWVGVINVGAECEQEGAKCRTGGPT